MQKHLYISKAFLCLAFFCVGHLAFSQPGKITSATISGFKYDYDSLHAACVVRKVLKGLGAEKAGIVVGDSIVKINGKELRGSSFDEINQFMKGDGKSALLLGIRKWGSISEKTVSKTSVNVWSSFPEEIRQLLEMAALNFVNTGSDPEQFKTSYGKSTFLVELSDGNTHGINFGTYGDIPAAQKAQQELINNLEMALLSEVGTFFYGDEDFYTNVYRFMQFSHGKYYREPLFTTYLSKSSDGYSVILQTIGGKKEDWDVVILPEEDKNTIDPSITKSLEKIFKNSRDGFVDLLEYQEMLALYYTDDYADFNTNISIPGFYTSIGHHVQLSGSPVPYFKIEYSTSDYSTIVDKFNMLQAHTRKVFDGNDKMYCRYTQIDKENKKYKIEFRTIQNGVLHEKPVVEIQIDRNWQTQDYRVLYFVYKRF